MPTQIYVNLPVKDLKKSIEFFTKLGFTFNPQFTDESATCMIISDTIYAMLITHKRFSDFTKKQIADAHKTTEVILAISTDSKEKVDEFVKKAVDAGGKTPMPTQDYGWMYNRSFEDLDGHMWEIFWMDPKGMPKQ